jgi:hypothetical protein
VKTFMVFGSQLIYLDLTESSITVNDAIDKW